MTILNAHSRERIIGLFGLARRARKLVDGQGRIIEAITSGEAKLVVLSEDAGANGNKKLRDKSASYEVPVVTFSNKEVLGKAIGRESVAAIAIVDEGLAAKLLERFGEL